MIKHARHKLSCEVLSAITIIIYLMFIQMVKLKFSCFPGIFFSCFAPIIHSQWPFSQNLKTAIVGAILLRTFVCVLQAVDKVRSGSIEDGLTVL